MNRITRNNYEEYLLDYVDNTLSHDLSQEMDSFLNLHPDIASEVLSFRNLKMTPDPEVKFLNKESLLRVEPVKKLPFSQRILQVAAIGLLLGSIGVYCLVDSKSATQQSSTLVNDNETSNQHEQREKVRQIENNINQILAKEEKSLDQLSTEGQGIVSLKSRQQTNQEQRKHGDHNDGLQSQSHLKLRWVRKPRVESKTNNPIYASRVTSQDDAGVSQKHSTQSTVKNTPHTDDGSIIKSRIQLPSIARVESLPLSDQLKSMSPEKEGSEVVAMAEIGRPNHSILKSIIKHSPLSKIDLDEITEGLIPTFAFTEVQFVPTYLEEINIIKQNLLKQ